MPDSSVCASSSSSETSVTASPIVPVPCRRSLIEGSSCVSKCLMMDAEGVVLSSSAVGAGKLAVGMVSKLWG
jgi:hypothetical protein